MQRCGTLSEMMRGDHHNAALPDRKNLAGKWNALFHAFKTNNATQGIAMKKLSTLTVALFLSAGMGFAQSNDATISQVGNNHEASIEQAGNTNIGSISVYGGSGSLTTIEQFGDFNQADMEDIRDNIEASQYQSGDNNTAYIGQARQNYTITQVQFGDDNSATFLGHNTSSVRGGTILQDQLGDGNTAEILGANNKNFMTQIQDGDYNVASVTGGNYSNNSTYMNQEGVENSAVLEFVGNATYNSSAFTQIGDDNMGFVSQMGENNTAAISQTGDSNTATIIQGL